MIRYISSDESQVRDLVKDLILERDPRKDIGLDVWAQLLEATNAEKWICDALEKNFGASDLTPEWFQEQFIASEAHQTGEYLQSLLLKLHPAEKLGHSFFVDILHKAEQKDYAVGQFCWEQITKLGPGDLDIETLKRFLVDPATSPQLRNQWISTGLIEPKVFPADFLKVLAYHPLWESNEWIATFKRSKEHLNELSFDEELSDTVLEWLGDSRQFTPDQVGFDWLMELVQRGEHRYHQFGVNTMVRAFLPADFAEQKESEKTVGPAEPEKEITVDLGGTKISLHRQTCDDDPCRGQEKSYLGRGSQRSGRCQNARFSGDR